MKIDDNSSIIEQSVGLQEQDKPSNTRKKKVILGFLAVLFTLVGGSIALAAYPLGDEYVRYQFEETSGNATNTGSTGITYPGVFGGNASTTSLYAKNGTYSAIFDTSGDFVNTGFGSGTSMASNPITISMWARKDSATPCSGGDKHLFGVSGTPAANRLYVRCGTTGTINMRVAGNTMVTGPVITADTWFHVAVVMTGTEARMYINGSLATTSAYSAYTLPGPIYAGNIWENGSTPANQGWGGQIDEFAIYNRALTAQEVSDQYIAFATLGAATGVTGYPYTSKVNLRWTAPTIASGTPAVTDYVIEYKTSAASTYSIFSDGTSTATSTTITGLTNGTAYNFRVVPVNSNGLGASSTPATSTPVIKVSLEDPTPNSTTVGTSSVTVYASSTDMYANNFQIVIETNPGGVLTSSFSTSTRTSDYNFNKLTRVYSNLNLTAAEDNYSGVAYVADTNSLFMVRNSRDEIKEYSVDGTLIRTITCSSCGDIEGIALVSSTASSTAPGTYDLTFMISTEDFTTNERIFRVTFSSAGAATVNANTYWQTGIARGSNLGLEGVAYNPATGKYYVGTEGTALSSSTSPIGIYEVTLGSAPTTSTTQICTNLSWATLANDLSDLMYANDTLYALSHESQKIIPINIGSTTNCTTGTQLSLSSITQAEGMTWSNTGDKLWVLGESDFLTLYQAPEVLHTFTGLANGNYRTYMTMTDVYGNTDTTGYRTFTVSYDATAPSVSSVSASVATSSALLAWDTNEAASSTVAYGLTTSYGSVATSTGTTTHSAALTSLTPGTLYYIRITATDAAGNVTITDSTFTTSALPTPTPTPSSDSSSTVTPGTQSAVGGSSPSETPTAIMLRLSNMLTNTGNPLANNPTQPIGGGGAVSFVTLRGVVFSKNLNPGSTSNDIKNLQRVLNIDPATRVATVGAGSSGKETTLFGPATKLAVQKLQLKYGIVASPKDSGYGVFGPKTRALVNSLLK